MQQMARERSLRGQSLVEFAVVLLVLIFILMGVFDLGRAFHTYVVITNAAREGAYYGAMHPDDYSGIIVRVMTEAQESGITLNVDDIDYSPVEASGEPKWVTVDYEFPLLFSFVIGGQAVHLRGRAEMVIY